MIGPNRNYIEPHRAQTPELREAIRKQKVKVLHSLIRDGAFLGMPAYIDAETYLLAKAHLPDEVPHLDDHMRKHYYNNA